MSDLQCAARVLLAGHGADAATLAAVASERRVAAVYCCDGAAAGSVGPSVAERLGLPLQALSHATTSAQLRAALQDLADVHRGELVLVVADAGAVTAVLAGMGGPSRADDREWTEVLIDSDGWALTRNQQG